MFFLLISFTTTFSLNASLQFGVFCTVSDIVFKADILPSCDFLDLSERQVSFACQALSVFAAVLITN